MTHESFLQIEEGRKEYYVLGEIPVVLIKNEEGNMHSLYGMKHGEWLENWPEEDVVERRGHSLSPEDFYRLVRQQLQ